MAYEARRSNDKEAQAQEDARSDAANQKAAKTALSAVEKTGGWWGAAAKAVNKADDLTGGKITELAGKGITKANKIAPGGKTAQKATNKLAESEAANKAMDAYNAKNGKGKDVAKNAAAAKGKKEMANQAKKGGEKKNSLPSSGGEKKAPKTGKGGSGGDAAPSEGESSKKSSGSFVGVGIAFGFLPIIAAAALPLVLVFLIFVPFLGATTSSSDFEDAFGISEMAGEDTGGLEDTVSEPEQQAFYERVIEVKNKFDSNGKSIEPLMIVSVYHALTFNEAEISYDTMTTAKITDIANAMLEDDMYNEEAFKNNLREHIIPDYLPNADEYTKEGIIADVFEYRDDYYELIGKYEGCATDGVCTYNIKGFYIDGSNFKKNISVNDLYVRLMQCGSYNGHNAGGQWGMPLEGEELIPFEKYILGVAYQEIGPGAPEEAFKAQLIAARSFILARPTQMGSSTKWRKLEKENGKWVLQVASCTADQVYCDPDKGCSAQNGDGQWKQVYSGTNHGGVLKGPLAQNSPLRTYASEVQGETVVNSQGYIVLTDYTDVETQKFASLARSGLDYKQILLQVYSNKYPRANINGIAKADCGSCVNTGEYTKWKQYEGEWTNVQIGNSGRTIKQIGCLVTSLSIQIAKSGVQTNISNFNPGTFVQALNNQGAFGDGGALLSYASVEKIAPSFKYQGYIDVLGKGKTEKLNAIKNIVNQHGVFAVAEVKGNTGQHWVAIDKIDGDVITMMDPGSTATNMWNEYNWANTSRIVYYKVS